MLKVMRLNVVKIKRGEDVKTNQAILQEGIS